MVAIDAGAPRRQIRVMLVDDHQIVRQGIRSLIEAVPDYAVCGEAADGEAALKAAPEARPDVIVMDVSMPKISGLDVIVEMKKVLPSTEILVLTMHDSEKIMAQALRAGARGYVHKTETGERLVEALT